MKAIDAPVEMRTRPQMDKRTDIGRVALSGAEAAALRDAYRLLRTIADRLPEEKESAAGDEPAARKEAA